MKAAISMRPYRLFISTVCEILCVDPSVAWMMKSNAQPGFTLNSEKCFQSVQGRHFSSSKLLILIDQMFLQNTVQKL